MVIFDYLGHFSYLGHSSYLGHLISFSIVFIFGACVGSFLNCVICRLALPNFSKKNLGGREKKKSFLSGRSFCPHCHHQLALFDLIPILSFVMLQGKCRYCQKKISLQYPLVEFFTGAFFFLTAFFLWQNTILANSAMAVLTSIYFFAVIAFLMIIFVYDLKHYIIPDKIVYPAIGVVFLYCLFEVLEFRIWDLFRISDLGFRILKALQWPLIVAFSVGTFFFLIWLLSHGRWMGLGDAKLGFLLGLFLGWPNILVALFSAFLIGAIIGIGLIVLQKKTLKSEVPFGPFLVAGTFIALFLGKEIVNWYFVLF